MVGHESLARIAALAALCGLLVGCAGVADVRPRERRDAAATERGTRRGSEPVPPRAAPRLVARLKRIDLGDHVERLPTRQVVAGANKPRRLGWRRWRIPDTGCAARIRQMMATRPRRRRFQRCYEQSIRAGSALSGHVTMWFATGPGGVRTDVLEDRLTSTLPWSVSGCFRNAIAFVLRDVRVPCEATFTIVFAPRG